MKFRILAPILVLLAAAAPPLWAQEGTTHERVVLRVISTGPGSAVTVDRGTRDGLAVGDRVTFFPRKGGAYPGSVTRVDDRQAVVEPDDKNFVPEPGTRGEALVRKESPDEDKPDEPDESGDAEEKGDEGSGDPGEKKDDASGGTEGDGDAGSEKKAPDHPPYENKDEDYKKGDPLLSGLKPIRPEQRGKRITGRAFLIADLTEYLDGDFTNSFVRAGTDLVLANFFGKGGTIRFSGELDYLTERDEEFSTDLLVRQLSYTLGGTRFGTDRWEFGRFLQHVMAEFGYLDGVEWSRRRSNGHRFGASIGWMPVTDDDFDTFQDFQLAAFYEWVSGLEERLRLRAGIQKTWHNGAPDRDLIVLTARYNPGRGWNLNATIWIDFYSGSDNQKDASIEISQALVTFIRTWESGNGVTITFQHLAFPELKRIEFWAIPEDIADGRFDRLTLDAWVQFGRDKRLHGHVRVWDDEDGTGGAVEGRFEVRNLFARGTRVEIALFGNLAQFEDTAGARLTFGRSVGRSRWDALYEISEHHLEDFPADVDDLILHRFRVSGTIFIGPNWDLTVYFDGRIYDSEFSWSIGFSLQKRF